MRSSGGSKNGKGNAKVRELQAKVKSAKISFLNIILFYKSADFMSIYGRMSGQSAFAQTGPRTQNLWEPFKKFRLHL